MAAPNDTWTQLNVGKNGDVMDETEGTYGSPPLVRKKPRVVIASNDDPSKLIDLLDAPPAGTELAVPVRQVGPAAVTGPLTDAQLRAAPIPITGTITETNDSIGPNGSPVPLSSTQIGGPDAAGNLRAPAVLPTAPTGAEEALVTRNIPSGTQAVSGPLTDAQLRATPVPVSGTVSTGGLTDAQLRATPVPVSGTVTATGPLTDAQLRASAVPVSGPLTQAQLEVELDEKFGDLGQKPMVGSAPVVIASDQSAVPVSGPLTDAQLRATAVPVSGTVTATGPLTDAQLRATPVPVSGPLTQAQLEAELDEKFGDLGQKTMAGSAPVVLASDQTAIPVTGPLTDAQLRASPVAVTGTVTETNDSIGLNGSPVPGSSTQIGGPDGSGNLRAPSVIATAPAGTEEALVTRNIPSGTQAVSGPLTDAQLRATPVPVSGTVTATGPLTDAQLRATPVPVSGPLTQAQLEVELDEKFGDLGQKTMAGSAPVVLASDQSAVPVSGPLTDAQLRATPVPVSGTVTATGPLTDTQLRASAVSTDPTDRVGRLLGILSAGTNIIGKVGLDAANLAGIALDLTVQAVRDRLPAALVGGRLDTNLGAWLGSTVPTVGQKTSAQSIPVVIASDQDVNVDVGTPDETAFTYGVSNQQTVGGVFQDTAPTLTAGQSGAARLTSQRALHQNLRDASGAELATAGNPVRVDPTGVTTQPISAASLPLPTGASTSANQTTLGSQTTKLNDGTNTAAVKAASTAPVATDPALVVAVSPNTPTLPVSVASLPLPTGAATAANQTTLGSQTSKINDGTNTAAVTGANALKVDGSAVTQPISAASLPLPTGAAQEHTTAASPNSSRLSDGAAFYDAAKTGQLPAALVGGRLDENVGAWLGSTAPTVGQKASASSLPVVVASDQSAIPVSAASLPLPAGAATAANQALELAQLQTINSLTPSVYDYISLGYTGADLTTVLFKLGGAGGTLVSTLTLAYSSGILQSVTKT